MLTVAMPISAASIQIERDPELQMRFHWSERLILALIGFLVLLMILILMAAHAARRLFGIRIPFAGRFLGKDSRSLDVAPLLEAELELLELKKQHGATFTAKDESDWRAARCRSIYESIWAGLPPSERLVMHQLAQGRFANPENREVIESLLRRGHLKLWPWPRIVETGFAEFLRDSEQEHQFAQMQRDAAKNLWQRIRIPLLIVVVVLAGVLMWFAGSAMQILSATLAGVAALFSSLTQVTSFARGGTKPNGQ